MIIIQEADYIFLMAISDWSIQRIETKIIIQKIKVKNFRLGKLQASMI